MALRLAWQLVLAELGILIFDELATIPGNTRCLQGKAEGDTYTRRHGGESHLAAASNVALPIVVKGSAILRKTSLSGSRMVREPMMASKPSSEMEVAGASLCSYLGWASEREGKERIQGLG